MKNNTKDEWGMAAAVSYEASTWLYTVTTPKAIPKKSPRIHKIIQQWSDAVIDILQDTLYDWLAQEHAELLKHNKTSLEITLWLGEKLKIGRWMNGEFYGRQSVLSTPEPDEVERLQGFLISGKQYRQMWARGSGASDFVPPFFQLDGYIAWVLFGYDNRVKTDKSIQKIAEVWEGMGKKYAKKEKYLKEQLGLDIQWNWHCLTGLRNAKGQVLEDSNTLIYIVGSPSTLFDSRALTLTREYAEINHRSWTTNAGLCLLAR